MKFLIIFTAKLKQLKASSARTLIILLPLLTTTHYVEGQDFHFTQYFNNPIYQNPSHSGLFKGKYRLIINNKSQWRSVTEPYKTLSCSFDTKILNSNYKNYIISGSLMINRDIAGDSRYSLLNFSGAISITKPINKKKNTVLAFAIQPCYSQNTIDYSKLIFDSQYIGGNFYPNTNSGETFNISTYNNFDLNSGLMVKTYVNKQWNYNFGFSISHLLQPQSSYLQNKQIRLNKKYITHGEASISLSNLWKIEPSVQISTQNKYLEVLFGSNASYSLGKSSPIPYAFIFGSYYRANDAIVSYTGFQYSSVKVGISYDVNTSRLKVASNYKGGFEFSIIYIFGQEKTKYYPIPCIII